MEADEEDVVGQKHETSPLVGNPAPSENLVSKITCLGLISFVRRFGGQPVLTNIFDLGVLHDELPHGEGGDVEENTRADHGDYSRNPS